MLKKIPKYLFFLIVVKPFIFWVLGVNVRTMEKLHQIKGAKIIVSNHNSHIDTLIIMSLFSMSDILKIRPVAAQDYFCKNRFFSFLVKTLIGIIPIERTVTRENKNRLFDEIKTALSNNETIIIYPEGTRGEDNNIGEFKSGIARIAKSNPNVPIIPLYINGPDKILPKIDSFLVPFISDIYVADPIYYDKSSNRDFTEKIKGAIVKLYMEHKRKETL